MTRAGRLYLWDFLRYSILELWTQIRLRFSLNDLCSMSSILAAWLTFCAGVIARVYAYVNMKFFLSSYSGSVLFQLSNSALE